MTLYEVNACIRQVIEEGFAVDEETGELRCTLTALDELKAERDEKLENIVLHIKNLSAEAKAIREEERKLAERRRLTESKVSRLREYIDLILSGESFRTPRASVTYRKTQSVMIEDSFYDWAIANRPELLRSRAPEADKPAIGRLLKAGEKIEGAFLGEGISMTIK